VLKPLAPLTLEPIGVVRSPWTRPEGMPIQPAGARDVAGRVVLEAHLAPGLADIGGFSHLILLYHFHAAGPARLQATPFLAGEPKGVFATRAPARPNPLGLSIVRLAGVRGAELDILDVDILDGTPLLDIKPYVSFFDVWSGKNGWFDGKLDKAQEYRVEDVYRGMADDAPRL